MDSCLIPVECNTLEYQVFENEARKRGMNLSEWILMVSRTYVPPAMWDEATNPKPKELTETEAHIELDKIEVKVGMAAPAPEPIQESKPTVQEFRPKGVSGHPCSFLASGIYPFNHNEKTCLGTCTNPSQRGKPCYFAANSAHLCGFYRPKVKPGHF